jgi:geranylgeranyl pyrophosphate synthase
MEALDSYNELCKSAQPAITAFLREFAARHTEDERLRAACLHLLGLGKLVRPTAVVAVARTFSPGIPLEACMHVAAAMELVHTFTLIHDDLPEMDNATLRRGVPAVHVEFGHDLGLLAGDGLFALAVMAIAEAPQLSPEVKIRVFRELAGAVSQVIEGQVEELALSGKHAALEQVESVERRKTAELIACSIVCGGLIGGAGEDCFSALREFGLSLGRAFQIMDDLLSATGDAAVVGKSLEQDEALKRPTIVRLLGVEGAQEHYAIVNSAATLALARLQAKTDTTLLQGLHESLVGREK